MKLLERTYDAVVVEFDSSELRALIGAFRETLEFADRLPAKEFEALMGVDGDACRRRLNEVRTYDAGKPVELTSNDAKATLAAMNVSLVELDDWEFDLRMGVTRDEMERVRDEVSELVPE